MLRYRLEKLMVRSSIDWHLWTGL